MNSVIEKEKKLNLALTKLKNLNLKNPEIEKDLEDLCKQKNQMMDKDVHIPSNDELLEELANYSARMENWEKN